MKIPFDIKFRQQIESGEYKVITGDDRPVRIISWDKKVFGGRTEIVALVPTPQGDTEMVQLYCPNGTLISSGWNEKFKLFIVTPGPDLSEFEDRLRIICENAVEEAHLFPHRTSEDFAKKHSAELLDLARKELQEKVIHDYWKQAADRCVQAREEGKAEALKDLPRWEKCADCCLKPKPSNEWIFSIDSENVTRESAIVHNGYFLPLFGLEKLPGFNK